LAASGGARKKNGLFGSGHRSVAAEAAGSAFQLGPLARLHRGELARGDASEVDYLVVDDPYPALANRSHAQLGLERHTELANHDHIERCLKRCGDLKGNRDASARQADHDHWLTPQMLQLSRKTPTGVGTISEHHVRLLRQHFDLLTPAVELLGPMVPNVGERSKDSGVLGGREQVLTGADLDRGERDVARVTEISARSPNNFEDAIKTGIERATETLRGVTSACVKEQQVEVGERSGCRVPGQPAGHLRSRVAQPQVGRCRPVQLAWSHLLRAETTRGRIARVGW
jgi:flavin-binding protein dodecin